MTKDEVSKQYNIPIEILDEYERWGCCKAVKKVMDVWQYDSTDLKNLGLIMALHDVRFNNEEIEEYMNLELNNSDNENSKVLQIKMLNEKRASLLDEIHFREKYLTNIDYLRREIEKNRKGKGSFSFQDVL